MILANGFGRLWFGLEDDMLPQRARIELPSEGQWIDHTGAGFRTFEIPSVIREVTDVPAVSDSQPLAKICALMAQRLRRYCFD